VEDFQKSALFVCTARSKGRLIRPFQRVQILLRRFYRLNKVLRTKKNKPTLTTSNWFFALIAGYFRDGQPKVNAKHRFFLLCILEREPAQSHFFFFLWPPFNTPFTTGETKN
jgi:hypothetical protein